MTQKEYDLAVAIATSVTITSVGAWTSWSDWLQAKVLPLLPEDKRSQFLLDCGHKPEKCENCNAFHPDPNHPVTIAFEEQMREAKRNGLNGEEPDPLRSLIDSIMGGVGGVPRPDDEEQADSAETPSR